MLHKILDRIPKQNALWDSLSDYKSDVVQDYPKDFLWDFKSDAFKDSL